MSPTETAAITVTTSYEINVKLHRIRTFISTSPLGERLDLHGITNILKVLRVQSTSNRPPACGVRDLVPPGLTTEAESQ
jgi:hypothetical protein